MSITTFATGDSSADDTDGHGTSVAGIIAANAGDLPVPGLATNVTGLSPDCELYVVDASSGSNAIYRDLDLANAIYWLDAQNVKLVSVSLGGQVSPNNYSLTDAAIAAVNADIVFITSAGNDGNSIESYPAAFAHPNIISVGGHNWAGEIASGSNRSATWVDLFAPSGEFLASGGGFPIPSCGGIGEPACDVNPDSGTVTHGVLTTTIGSSYTNAFSGTSAAAPHVTAVGALLSKRFHLDSPLQIRDRILQSVIPGAPFTGNCVTGGRLNANRAGSVFSFVPSSSGTTWRFVSSADGTKDLGWVIDEDYPWIYHEHLGWLYHDSSGAYTDSLFFYHQTHGWLFTNESIYGFFYVLDLGQFKTMAELL